MSASAVEAIISGATDAYELACELLDLCNKTSTTPSPRDDIGDRWEQWNDLVILVRAHFSNHKSREGRLGDSDRRELIRLLRATTGQMTPMEFAHAVAWGVDLERWETFFASWEAARCGDDRPLQCGEMFPVADAEPSRFGVDVRMTTRPSTMHTPADELPHIRRWNMRPEDVEVRLDCAHSKRLAAVLGRLRRIATVHLNRDLTELDQRQYRPHQVFPVVPRSLSGQRTRLEQAFRADNEQIVLAGELVLTEALAQSLINLPWSYGDRRLLVLGSYHHEVGGVHANTAVAIVPGRPVCHLAHRKTEPCTLNEGQRDAVREAIQTMNPPRLRLWTAGRWRVAIAICKDLLRSKFTQALCDAGANLVVVPTMTHNTS
jgi:hypothetical protein